MLHELLQIPENAQIISICGAGGKTSLMHMLAREAHHAGKKTAMMTTTHIFPSEDPDVALWDNESLTDLNRIWNEGKIVCAGMFHKGYKGKFGTPSLMACDILQDEADRIYVEADGANRKPMKYPAVWEPVIAHHSESVIVVAGLSALGKPIDEVCQRANLIREILDISAEILGENEMAAILAAGYGRYRPTVLLNQADTPELIARAEAVRAFLLNVGIPRVAIASLEQLNNGPAYRNRKRDARA